MYLPCFHLFITPVQVTSLFFFWWWWGMPCGMQDFSSLTKNRAHAPVVKAWSPNHWTAREFPGTLFLK